MMKKMKIKMNDSIKLLQRIETAFSPLWNLPDHSCQCQWLMSMVNVDLKVNVTLTMRPHFEHINFCVSLKK